MAQRRPISFLTTLHPHHHTMDHEEDNHDFHPHLLLNDIHDIHDDNNNMPKMDELSSYSSIPNSLEASALFSADFFPTGSIDPTMQQPNQPGINHLPFYRQQHPQPYSQSSRPPDILRPPPPRSAQNNNNNNNRTPLKEGGGGGDDTQVPNKRARFGLDMTGLEAVESIVTTLFACGGCVHQTQQRARNGFASGPLMKSSSSPHGDHGHSSSAAQPDGGDPPGGPSSIVGRVRTDATTGTWDTAYRNVMNTTENTLESSYTTHFLSDETTAHGKSLTSSSAATAAAMTSMAAATTTATSTMTRDHHQPPRSIGTSARQHVSRLYADFHPPPPPPRTPSEFATPFGLNSARKQVGGAVGGGDSSGIATVSGTPNHHHYRKEEVLYQPPEIRRLTLEDAAAEQQQQQQRLLHQSFESITSNNNGGGGAGGRVVHAVTPPSLHDGPHNGSFLAGEGSDAGGGGNGGSTNSHQMMLLPNPVFRSKSLDFLFAGPSSNKQPKKTSRRAHYHRNGNGHTQQFVYLDEQQQHQQNQQHPYGQQCGHPPPDPTDLNASYMTT